jgi:dsRNA-specific ribonuclease
MTLRKLRLNTKAFESYGGGVVAVKDGFNAVYRKIKSSFNPEHPNYTVQIQNLDLSQASRDIVKGLYRWTVREGLKVSGSYQQAGLFEQMYMS